MRTQQITETGLLAMNAMGREGNWPKVGIVVLNWNAWDMTERSLDSLNRLRYPNYEVILVDNDSTEAQPEGFERKFPDLVFVQTEANLGYTGGNNAGIRVALQRNADFILILNNDVLARDPDLLMQLVTLCRDTPSAGIAAPRVVQYNRDGVEIGGRYYGRGQALLSLLIGGNRTLPNRVESFQRPGAEVTSVTQVCGCAMLIARTVFEQVGCFDERLFMYDDEYDLCLRVIDAGFQVLQVSSTSVVRLNVCGQDKMPAYRTYLLGRNRFLLAMKRKHWLHSTAFICFHLAGSFKLAITLLRHRRWLELTSLLNGLRDGILCRRGITPQLRTLLGTNKA